MGRAKHWIRIDRYYEGEFPNIKVRYRPVLCQHCDDAPVRAGLSLCTRPTRTPRASTSRSTTAASELGIARTTVRTRSRFFDWFAPEWDGPLDLQLNPDVSIRPAGVVEKCTFCAHRIKRAKLDADAEGRDLADGDVQPACVQSCPAEAMVFGDMSDSQSKVSRQIESGRSETAAPRTWDEAASLLFAEGRLAQRRGTPAFRARVNRTWLQHDRTLESR